MVMIVAVVMAAAEEEAAVAAVAAIMGSSRTSLDGRGAKGSRPSGWVVGVGGCGGVASRTPSGSTWCGQVVRQWSSLDPDERMSEIKSKLLSSCRSAGENRVETQAAAGLLPSPGSWVAGS